MFCNSNIFFLISYLSENKENLINIISRIAILNLFLGTLNLLPIGSLMGESIEKYYLVFYWSKSKGRHALNKINYIYPL